MATETELRKKLVPKLQTIGAKVIPYVGSTMGLKGTSDIFLAHRLWHGWIEFKGPTTDLKKLQWQFILDMRKRGVNALVLRMYAETSICFDEEKPFTCTTGNELIEALADYDCLEIRTFNSLYF